SGMRQRRDALRCWRTGEAHLRRIEARAVGERESKNCLWKCESGVALAISDVATVERAASDAPHCRDKVVLDRERIRRSACTEPGTHQPETTHRRAAALEKFSTRD